MTRYSLLSLQDTEKTSEIINATLGKTPADLAIMNGTLINVYTGELLEGYSITINGEWITYVGDNPGNAIGPETQIIDAKNKVIAPGFIDGHTHLADWFCLPSEFLRFAMAGGTTTIITETIEPYPIRGYEGVVDFLSSLEDQPVKIFALVPAMASTSSKVRGISQETLGKLLMRDDVLGLGESYWQAVFQEPEIFFPIFEQTLASGKKLEGHTAGAKGRRLMAYVASGISSCHEPINADEALDRLRLGLHVMAREGSVRRDLDSLCKLKDADIDLRRLLLVTDGLSPEDLLEKGYMEYVVQKAIDCGFDPVTSIQMATINVADYFQLDGIIGGISPGKQADIVILPELKTISPSYVISKGQIIAKDGKILVSPRKHTFSADSLNAVRLPREVRGSDFKLPVDNNASEVQVRIIEMVTDLVTKETMATVPVIDGEIGLDSSDDLLKIAAIDRSHSPGKTFVGLVKGFGLASCALASSSAWDTSDIITVGDNVEDMATAVNRIYALQGGAVFCAGGKILAEIPLQVFGLIADMPMEELADRSRELTKTVKEFGCPLTDPLQSLITLTGAAIPFIRICEEGLVDIKTGKTLGLLVD